MLHPCQDAKQLYKTLGTTAFFEVWFTGPLHPNAAYIICVAVLKLSVYKFPNSLLNFEPVSAKLIYNFCRCHIKSDELAKVIQNIATTFICN